MSKMKEKLSLKKYATKKTITVKIRSVLSSKPFKTEKFNLKISK